jgi:hypothetical protein
MTDARVYIHAGAALGPRGDSARAERTILAADPPPFEFKELVKQVVGVPLRQASHLVELAAVASQLCLKRLPFAAPEDTAVYVGTGLAEVRKTQALFQQVMPPGPGMASPFDFINAANNMAAFYVAKLGNFRARNLTVTQEEFSFEWALKLATEDLRAGRFRQALVGGLDESSQPRANHLRRIALRDDQILGEGAGFLYLSVEARGALAELLGVHHVTGTPAAALSAALGHWRRAGEPLTLLPGFRLTADELHALQIVFPDTAVHPYLEQCGCFHTAIAFGVAAQLDAVQPAPGLVIHLNHDATGRVMLTGLRTGD